VFKHYFEELEEESLRDNFVVVVSILAVQEYQTKSSRYIVQKVIIDVSTIDY
jgi:hypothetical protein